MISQTRDGQIILGHRGERVVGHYTFYAAFNTPEEYRLECDGRMIGTLPIDKPLVSGQFLVFAAKRWEVLQVNAERKLITLKRAVGGKPPIFGGGAQTVHDIVRQEMLRVYNRRDMPIYLNQEAKLLLGEGFETFHTLELNAHQVLQLGTTVHLLPWLGDRIVNTITVLLRLQGLSADCYGGIVDVTKCSVEEFHTAAKAILREPRPSPCELASALPDTIVEKHDHLVQDELRNLGYGVRFFDVDGAWQWFASVK